MEKGFFESHFIISGISNRNEKKDEKQSEFERKFREKMLEKLGNDKK